MTKLFLESEFKHKGNKQMKKKKKKMNSKQNLAFFSVATVLEHQTIQILQRKGQNKIWTELSSLGQEPTFNVTKIFMDA